MSFDLLHGRKWRQTAPTPRAVSPQAAHEYELLATVAACENLKDVEISRILGLDPDFAYRLYRSTSGRAFVDWIKSQPDELREHYRLKEDLDPMTKYLQGVSSTEATPGE